MNSVASTKFYGPFIGVYSENMKAEYDDLKVAGTAITTSGNLCTMFPLFFQSAKNNFEYIKGDKLDPSDTTLCNVSVHLLEDENPELSFFPFLSRLYLIIKNNPSQAEANKYNDNLVLQLKKCLPGYVFTKSKDEKGLPRYIITEKIKTPGKKPETILAVSKAEFFITTLNFILRPDTKTEPTIVAKPVSKEIIPEGKKPTSGWIVIDSFKNNDNKWYVDSSDLIDYKVFNGNYYRMKNKSDAPRTSLNTFRINDNDAHDYKIETVVQNLFGPDDELFGLVFGQHANSGFYFLVTNGGYYKIVGLADTSATIMQDLTFCGALRLNDDKQRKHDKKVKLGVFKVKDTWRFFINEREVYSCKARHLGEKVGFLIPAKATVYTDYIKIYDWTVAEKFPKDAKEIIYNNVFIDDFFTNENHLVNDRWSEANDKNVECSFEGTVYDIKNKTTGHYVSLHEISSDKTADHRIQILLSHYWGANDKPLGLCFAASDTANMFLFTISPDRKFSISNYIGGKWSYMKEAEASDAIYPNIDYTNTLLFEQTKGKWNFYINRKLVYTCNSTILPGNKIGCYVEGEQTARFEYITYDKIEYQQ